MDLTLNALEATVRPFDYRKFVVDLGGVEKKDLLDSLDMQVFIDHFGVSELLDQIGIEEVKKHFDLTEKEEE